MLPEVRHVLASVKRELLKEKHSAQKVNFSVGPGEFFIL